MDSRRNEIFSGQKPTFLQELAWMYDQVRADINTIKRQPGESVPTLKLDARSLSLLILGVLGVACNVVPPTESQPAGFSPLQFETNSLDIAQLNSGFDGAGMDVQVKPFGDTSGVNVLFGPGAVMGFAQAEIPQKGEVGLTAVCAAPALDEPFTCAVYDTTSLGGQRKGDETIYPALVVDSAGNLQPDPRKNNLVVSPYGAELRFTVDTGNGVIYSAISGQGPDALPTQPAPGWINMSPFAGVAQAAEVTKTPTPTATVEPKRTQIPTETKTITPIPPTKEPTLEPWKAEMERKLQGVFGSEWMGDGKGLNQNGINKYGEFNLQFVFGDKSSIVKDYPITLGGVQGVRVKVGAEAFYLYKGKLSSVKVATVLEFTREDGSKYLCELLEVKPITESTIRERANGTPENPYNPGLGGYYGNPTLGYRAGVSVELDSNQYDGKSLTCGPQVQELLAIITNTTEYKDFIASGKPSEDLVLVPTGFGFGTGGVIDIKGESVDLEN